MSAINDTKELERLIAEALGSDANPQNVRQVRLLCRDLILEVRDECRSATMRAVSEMDALTKAS